jgi:amino acid adenylation domain-containing protein
MSDRLSNLSPAKRRFLLEKLREQAAERGVAQSERTPSLEVVPRDGELPLSFSQQRLWFLDQFDPGGSFYNIPAAYRLRGALDREALARSLDEIVRRHEALRTSFGTVDGRPVQRIAPAAPVRLHTIDLTGLPEGEREAKALEAGLAEARHGFDMENGPLFRVTLIALSPREHLLILNMHHIISDGWSIGVLTTELSTLYRAAVAGEPSPLPELPIQYADFAAWQHRLLQGEALERQIGYWRKHLEGAPATSELPVDRPRPAVQRFHGLTYSFSLPARLSRALREMSQREDATLFMTMLAAFKALVFRFTGQEDLVVGAGIANRTRIETEPLIGFFVNTLAMRTSLAGNPTFRELLHRVRDTALGAYAHQDLPFEKLVEELRPQRDLSRNPLVQLAFVLQNAPMPPLDLPSLSLEPVDLEVASAKFDWLLSIWDTEPEITGSLEFNSDLFDLETVERMIGRYTELLEAFAADPGLRIHNAPLFASEIAASLGLAPGKVEAVAPLTTTQRDLYLDQALNPESVIYSLGVSARLGTEVDPALWQAAAAAVVEREPMTRVRFTEHRGQPVQVIERGAKAACEILTLDDPSEEAWTALVREKVKVRYSLRDGGLFRAFLVRGLPGGDVALLAFHHIVADAFSGRLLLERIAAAYEALAAGREPAPAALTFLDDVGESLARFDTPETERFWAGRLAGVAPLELHSGVDRPSLPSRRRAVLAGDDLARLDRFCADRGLSRAAVLRGLFGALLDRLFSPQGDLLVYDVVGGRPREHAGTIGCFYQVVPVVFGRDRLQPEVAIDDWFTALRQDRRELGARQNLSVLLGKRLVRGEKLRFFYNFYNFAGFQALGNPTALQVHDSFPEDEVHLIASDNGDRVEVTAHWNERLFSDLALADRLLALVRQVTDGAATLGGLDVMLAPERRQVLSGWNDTTVEYRETHNLQILLEEQARRTPEAVAVTCEGESLTYAELHRRANQLAWWLRSVGVGPETIVATAVERSCEMAVSLLGILKAGGAYVPLDPDYPEERLRYMLADSGAAVLLLGRRDVPGLDGFAGPVLRVPTAAGELARQPGSDLPCETTGESLAYVIYTSGSTGRPKGAMNTHRAIVNRLLWMQQEYGLTAADRVLQKTPLSFDVSVWEVFWPLLTGARLVLARPEGHKDPGYLARLIREQEVTTLHFVPSMLRIFLEEKSAGACDSLRRVICSGEALPYDLQERFFARLGTAELHNLYGPTEAAVDVTYWACVRDGGRPVVPIGQPVANTRIYLLDREMRPVPAGIAGELYIGGVQPARGYLGRPDLTADRFVPDPFEQGGRLYKTGDLARHLPDGEIEYLGRIDHQVKLRGFRIELGEIEAVLARVPGVRETLLLVREDVPGDKALVAYLVAGDAAPRPGHAELARFARQSLPDYMVPAHFVWLDAMPLLPNGKADRRSLPAPEAARPELAVAFAAARSETEQAVVALWQDVLRVPKAGAEDNFFDLGGHSLLLVQVQARVRERFGRDLSMVELFRHPTARSLAAYLDELAAPPAAPEPKAAPAPAQPERRGSAVAVVGLAGRFPGAGSVEELWEKLRTGTELITFYSREELTAAGVEPELLDRPDYVPAKARLADVDKFDAAFFGLSPREAEILDPQHRLFLEAAWEALEDAGYDPQRAGRVGVFAGQSVNSYLLFNLVSNPRVMNAVGFFQAVLGNDKDYLATRTSYKLGLKGPSLTVQTACSTSLVAVHLACRSLLDGECDMALAGGVSVSVPAETGYLYQQGSIVSPDGHCRAFDAQAQGTVPGNGLGIVVLKRLDDALRDGDTIRAVILGSALNNDGADKVGYTAPSVDGQVDVLTSALARAGVDAGTIGYVEAHGTGTPLGDPIEVAALKSVFPADLAPGSVALGSIKTNLGHLDAAAGVTGLIKAVLSLENGEIPPSLHFGSPNPELGLEGSPFRVNAEAEAWPRGTTPRRAGVSSFGIGGTNVHVVLEEAPAISAAADRATERPHVLTLSARTETALDAASARLADHLRRHPEQPLADVAWTLQAGRRAFPHRRVVVARSAGEAVEALSGRDPRKVRSRFEDGSGRPVAFLFPGQGAQHPGMAAGLYDAEPAFRERVDRCAEILIPHLGLDLRDLLFPAPEREEEAKRLLDRTRFTQPALFTIELALAGMWMDRGLRPAALLGHSIGELVAATLAGVFELPDALALVALRGRLMDELPGGAMLSVPLPEAEVAPLLGPGLSLAAVNGPALLVVAGAVEAVEDLARRLEERGVACRRLHTSHAFHSYAMEPAVAPFTEAVSRVSRKEPRIPFLSGTTGTWITPQQATDPAYWGRHLREPIRFASALTVLAGSLDGVLLEVGPGNTLATMARRQLGEAGGVAVLTSLPHPRERAVDRDTVAEALGKLWLHGVQVDWAALRGGARRVPLPTYPFERQRYWIEAQAAPVADAASSPEKALERSEPATLPAHRSTARSRPYAPPETEVERGIAALWEEVLGVEAVGRTDEFFELGGHSLMGIQLIARLQERFPVKVAVDDLFDQPTVASLAELVEARLLDYLDNLSDHEAASWLESVAAGG